MPRAEVKEGRTAFEDYQVSPGQSVRLDVTVNHGQPGGVTVKLGSKTVAKGAHIRAVPLGKGSALAGKTLKLGRDQVRAAGGDAAARGSATQSPNGPNRRSFRCCYSAS